MSTPLIVGGVIIVLVVIIAAVVAIVIINKKKNEQTSPPVPPSPPSPPSGNDDGGSGGGSSECVTVPAGYPDSGQTLCCPTGETKIGDGSACSGGCALYGNPTRPRCPGASPVPAPAPPPAFEPCGCFELEPSAYQDGYCKISTEQNRFPCWQDNLYDCSCHEEAFSFELQKWTDSETQQDVAVCFKNTPIAGVPGATIPTFKPGCLKST